MIAHIADVWTKTLNKKGEQKLKKSYSSTNEQEDSDRSKCYFVLCLDSALCSAMLLSTVLCFLLSCTEGGKSKERIGDAEEHLGPWPPPTMSADKRKGGSG